MVRVMLVMAMIILLAAPQVSRAQTEPQWIDVTGPQGAKLRALVFRPSGAGPFPVVVVLHGAPFGLRDLVIPWGGYLAREGFITIVGCYFKGTNTVRVDPSGAWTLRRVPGAKDVNPCPEAPVLQDARPVENIVALMDAGRRVPGARPDRLGLVGWSTGGGMAALVASSGANVQAVVSVAGSFREALFPNEPRSAMSVVQDLRAPILIIHGTLDDLEPVKTSKDYEARARELGKNVHAIYLEEDLIPYSSSHSGLPKTSFLGQLSS